MLPLNRPELFVADAMIGGEFLARTSGGRTPVEDPATGTVLAQVSRCGKPEALAAIDAAQVAYPAWRRTPATERAAVLVRLATALRANRQDVATILTAEQGKPLAEARNEVDYALGYLDYYADFGRHLDGELLSPSTTSDRMMVVPEPIGIAVAITPWNFPLAMIARKLAPAFVAGNVLIIKPAEATPLTTLAFARLAVDVGVPPGVLAVLTGDRDDAAVLGETLLSDARVRKLSFTGSTSVGRALYAACAPTIKRLSLELGGNAPFVVFEDADLDHAADCLIQAKFRNAGQACVAANRILVQRSVHDAFVERVATRMRALRVGPGTEAGVQVGPLVDARAVAKVKRHLEDAVARGAKVVVGGGTSPLGGNFVEPTLLTGVEPSFVIACEETFGPVAGILAFDTEEEAIALANDTPFGLAAYVQATDPARIARVSDAIESGMVAVNVGALSNAVAPFGGVKQSGLGREGGKQGLEDWLVRKYIRVGERASSQPKRST